MKHIDASEAYEIIAELYNRRFGQMAPGKSVPMARGTQVGDLSCEENSKRFQDYLRSEDERYDFLDYIAQLQNKIEAMERET